MDYPWELVLDHSYAGVPGVIFDQSPARAGHGTAIGIADADFLIDGSGPRSGAVRLRGGNRSIHANLGEQWAVTGGVAIDIVCSSEAIEHNGTLIESEVFNLEVSSPRTFQGWVQTQGGSVGFADPEPYQGELAEWNTVSLLFDGWQFLDVSINGSLALSFPDRGNYWPLLGGQHIAIGNRLNGTDGLHGVIDDVKIWRLNPRRVDDNLRHRPVFNDVSTAWSNWGRSVVLVFKDDPECADEVRHLMEQAIGALRRAVPTDDAYDRWEADAQQYATAFTANKLHLIPPIATATLHWMRDQGIEPMNLPELQALLRSRCFKKVLDGTIGPHNGDNAFHNMILGIAQGY
jgi:hypothetical protein